ncbi:hypothetical protein, partial [Aeromonas sp. 604534]|uniref:hypothetical protein n=1 Tax=Aeromonas sp. 604534 TaxID=2712055 RepID=UPI003B9E92D6
EEDGGDQITESSVSSIQAASIWATTPYHPLKTLFVAICYKRVAIIAENKPPNRCGMSVLN